MAHKRLPKVLHADKPLFSSKAADQDLQGRYAVINSIELNLCFCDLTGWQR